MPQVINTNIASMNAQRNLDRTQGEGDTALERLSSGLRINSAADDAAGLAISTRFESQTQGLDVGIRNANDGVSLAQTAEGALGSMTDNLQRVRELALQSANATNSAQDRASLNEEVQELKAEIKRVSEQTNFNGTKLLDGSFEEAFFQIGANRGETVGVDISGATVDKLGAAQTDGITSFASQNALTGGDLVINGVSVGDSSAGPDDSSEELKSASAISKAAAVNAVSDQSGVEAVVNETSVSGSALDSSVDLPAKDNSGPPQAFDIAINDINITMPDGSDQTPENFMSAVAKNINDVSGKTGVTAEFDTDPSRGIKLVAEDGRNITLDANPNGATLEDEAGNAIADGDIASMYGLPPTNEDDDGEAAKSTFTGTYSLISKEGSEIDLDSSTGDIANAGFQVGQFSGNNSGAVSKEVGPNALDSGDLTLNGVTIGDSVSTFDDFSTENSNPASSALAKATAINESSDQTGVTAKANATTFNAESLAGTDSANFEVNGRTINVDFSGANNAADRQQEMVTEINKVSGKSGVTAEAVGDSFRLVAEDGINIEVSNFGGGGDQEDFGFPPSADVTGDRSNSEDTFVTRGSVSLQSAGKIEIGSLNTDIESSGFDVGTYGANESGQLLQDVDISTVEGANDAITSMDNALNLVNRQRANLGSIQNRFESTIENQQVASENLQAANSRIRDADFAEESAELARTQTLQQAGISILSQANQRPQQVLQLLQG